MQTGERKDYDNMKRRKSGGISEPWEEVIGELDTLCNERVCNQTGKYYSRGKITVCVN